MPLLKNHKKIFIILSVIIIVCALFFCFLFFLRPTNYRNSSKINFQIDNGARFNSIVADLKSGGLIRSALVFKILSVLEGRAASFKPGYYELSQNMSSWDILDILTKGNQEEVSVVIPEGSDLAEIDAILSGAQVLRKGALINYQNSITNSTSEPACAGGQSLEGCLFPDTYNFFIGSNVQTVIKKIIDNFNQKALPVLKQNDNNIKENLIIASLVEKEAADSSSRAIIAGIIKKRIANHMPLQIDATICYIKEQILKVPYQDCSPITSSDLKINSPYNTYLNLGLPPGPISNPGLSSIEAAIHSQASPYWYYLSDPKTGKIIFAENYTEQQQNEAEYLGR
ncbi:MAG: endolytic transglycosylase MltG [Patescibacteria group bacterium]|nr:endolytic transglycosylase MltG [Patescibacteria group bacterium]